jgi:peptidoglycan hydrolase CwlO-like protein
MQMTAPSDADWVNAMNDVARLTERVRALETAINGPLGWKAEYADNLRQLSETRKNLNALHMQAVRERDAANDRAAIAEAERDALRAYIKAMASELLDLRGSFPSERHQKLYDAAIDAARSTDPSTGERMP